MVFLYRRSLSASHTSSNLILFWNTEVPEKNGIFIYKLLTERHIYLRDTQKQLKTTSYGPNKSILEIYLLYIGV